MEFQGFPPQQKKRLLESLQEIFSSILPTRRALSTCILNYKLRYFIYVEWMISKAVVFSVAGHGMIVEGHPDAEHWGRRLMASVPDNETEQKNCSAPGMLFH